jgi:transposase
VLKADVLSYSVLPALSLDGILHAKIVENGFKMDTFNEFISELLTLMNPYDPVLHPANSVIILDNCRIHKDPQMIQMVHDWWVYIYHTGSHVWPLYSGMRIEFLPPYSPDLNPIELCFSAMKAWIRRHADEANQAWEDNDNPDRAVWILYDMAFWPTPRMALGWFTKAGII